MAPYFRHLLNAILELEYLEALNKLSLERYRSYKERWLPSMQSSEESFLPGVNFQQWFGNRTTTSQNFSDTFSLSQIVDLKSFNSHTVRIMRTIHVETILSMAFGILLLSTLYTAYRRYAKKAREHLEEEITAVNLERIEQSTSLFRSNPLNSHITAITTPYRSTFLQSHGGSSNQAVLAPLQTPNKTQSTSKNKPPPINVSPLTPDTAFNEVLRNIEEKEEENDLIEEDEHNNHQPHPDDDDYSQSYSIQSGMSKSFSETKSWTTQPTNSSVMMTYSQSESGPSRNMMHLQVLQLSMENPGILIGWKIFVPAYGNGVILSMKRKKFHTTRFNIQFENYTNIIDLPLQRGKNKGKIPFTLIGKLK